MVRLKRSKGHGVRAWRDGTKYKRLTFYLVRGHERTYLGYVPADKEGRAEELKALMQRMWREGKSTEEMKEALRAELRLSGASRERSRDVSEMADSAGDVIGRLRRLSAKVLGS